MLINNFVLSCHLCFFTQNFDMLKHLPLEINSINKSFKKHHVLRDLNIQVQEGSIFGLVGLNGIGKTTLIKIILGLLAEDQGSVNIFGMKNTNIEAKRRYSYLPEKFHPSMFLKGSEFLEISLGYYQKAYSHSEAAAIAETLSLDPQALEQQVLKYSKGMGQKLGLLSVFLTNAPLLILDEPMSGLDPRARISLKEKILNYRDKGNTIFFQLPHTCRHRRDM